MGNAVAVGMRALLLEPPPPGRLREGRMFVEGRSEDRGLPPDPEGKMLVGKIPEGTEIEETEMDIGESDTLGMDTLGIEIEDPDNDRGGTVKLRSVGTEIKVVMPPRPVVGTKLVRDPVRLRSVGRLTVMDGATTMGVIEISVGSPFASVVEIQFVPGLGPLMGGTMPEGSKVGKRLLRDGRLPLGMLMDGTTIPDGRLRDGRLPLGMLIEGRAPEGSEVGSKFVRDGRLPLGRMFVGKVTGGVIDGIAVRSLRRELRAPPPPLGLRSELRAPPLLGMRIEEITDGRP